MSSDPARYLVVVVPLLLMGSAALALLVLARRLARAEPAAGAARPV